MRSFGAAERLPCLFLRSVWRLRLSFDEVMPSSIPRRPYAIFGRAATAPTLRPGRRPSLARFERFASRGSGFVLEGQRDLCAKGDNLASFDLHVELSDF